MFKNPFSKPEEPAFTEEEAIYAQTANDEIAEAVNALLKIVEKGCINKKIPRQIEILAKMLEGEAQSNYHVIESYISQNTVNEQEKLS